MAVITNIETGIYLYDLDVSYNQGDNFSGIAPLQRVLIRVRVDGEVYNQNITQNDASGSFIQNLKGHVVYLTDTLPIPNQAYHPTLNQATLLPPAAISLGSTSYETYVIIRGKEEWANLNQPQYIVFRFQFRYIKSDGSLQTDYLMKVVTLTFRKIDIGENIELVGFFDKDGIAVEEQFCDDYKRTLRVALKSKLQGTFTQIVLKDITNEENQHDNTFLLERLDSLDISSILPVNPIGFDDIFGFSVDAARLTTGEEECFTTVLIREDPPPVISTCPCIVATIAQVAGAVGTNQQQHTTTVTVNGVTSLEVATLTLEALGFITLGSPTPSRTAVLDFFTMGEKIIAYTASLTLLNGCTYVFTSTFTAGVNVSESSQQCG